MIKEFIQRKKHWGFKMKNKTIKIKSIYIFLFITYFMGLSSIVCIYN